MLRSLPLRIGILAGFSLLVIGGFCIIYGPIEQPLAYHQFADQRPMVGVPHSLNVLSNLPFVIVGAMGLAFMASQRSMQDGVFVESSERWPYWTYFIGLVLTGIGSAYYHADPNNARLVWDRLPLTVTFMGLFTAILAEHVHPACARWMLAPLVIAGAASVFYWDWTEKMGVGDLRPYLVVQVYPLVALPFLLIFYPPRYTHLGDLVASLLCYMLAKGCEMADQQFYTASGFVSGHTLKHLVAGLAAFFIFYRVWRRVPISIGLAFPQPHSPAHTDRHN